MSTSAAVSAPRTTPTSRKIVVHRGGSYNRLQLESCATPVPGPGQVRIDVRAIGVNFADTLVRMGLYSSAKESIDRVLATLSLPKLPRMLGGVIVRSSLE